MHNSRSHPLGKGARVIYQQLRQEIVSGQLPERTILQQAELADRFGVSRTPVREALQQLAHDGLVELSPGQTAYVSPITLKDSLEIRQVRVWLEVPALLLAVEQENYLAGLFELMGQITALPDDYTPEAGEKLLALDEQFHRWLLRTAGNRRVERIVGDLLDIMYRDHAFNVAHGYKDTRDSLLQIETAVRAGDRAGLARLLTEHIAGDRQVTAGPVGGLPMA